MQFTPNKLRGSILLIGLGLLFLSAGGTLTYLAFQQANSGVMLLMLVGGLVLLVPVPILTYNAYTLVRARYILDRDGLRIRWGLRYEDIPLPEIQWVRPIGQMGYAVQTPFFTFLGILQGLIPCEELGRVEFFATSNKQTILIATSRDVYALSPQRMDLFLNSLQDAVERGSLSPISWQSERPVSFIGNAFKVKTIRYGIIAGFLLNVALITAASILMPRLDSVQFGFASASNEPVPANRLMLLPTLSLMVFVLDVAVGFFLYRKEDTRGIAQIVFLSSIITPTLLLISLVFLLI